MISETASGDVVHARKKSPSGPVEGNARIIPEVLLLKRSEINDKAATIVPPAMNDVTSWMAKSLFKIDAKLSKVIYGNRLFTKLINYKGKIFSR
jgi:hypothetical protein